jgi:hypothetical protein
VKVKLDAERQWNRDRAQQKLGTLLAQVERG